LWAWHAQQAGRAPQHPRELELGSASQDQHIWVQATRADPFFISNRFEPNTCKIFFHDSMRVPHYFIGLVVGLLVFISTTVTTTKGYAGVGMNPARCLGPALHYKISQFYRRINSIGVWLEVRRWFFYRHHHRRITSVGFPFVGDSPFRRYIGRQNKKTICRWFYRRNLRAKKKDSHLKYTNGFLVRRWYRDLPTATNRR